MRHFCYKCEVNLLSFIADDLNKISLDSYDHRKTRKYYISLLC